MQRALNGIEMQGHSDDENADILDQPIINPEVVQQNPGQEEIVQ
jgi:hypothetical protein